ncbi:MAG: 50S ribosomal protein L6 [Candidatus Omnitrophica bacterium]|nr:50S ribosomal protein L6 [Candidatus Omnitrophota bacterium]
MSRIGKKPIGLPKGVKATFKDGAIYIEGPKGKLQRQIPKGFPVEIADGKISIKRPSDLKQDKAYHGLYRNLINCMVVGVTEGYVKELDLVGVGYRVQLIGKTLNFQLGFSHPVEVSVPEGIDVEVIKQNKIIMKSIKKDLIGAFAADVRALYKPEPYKGKGIKYSDELVRRKAGKTVA